MDKSTTFGVLTVLVVAMLASGIIALRTLDYIALIVFLILAITIVTILIFLGVTAAEKKKYAVPAERLVRKAHSSLERRNVDEALKHYDNLRQHFHKHHHNMTPEDKKKLHRNGMKIYGRIFKAAHGTR